MPFELETFTGVSVHSKDIARVEYTIMDLYWEKVVENVLGDAYGGLTPSRYSDNSVLSSSCSPQGFTRVSDDYERSSSTRRRVRSRTRKKSVSDDEIKVLSSGLKKLTFAPEESKAFESLNYIESIPRIILKPQHDLRTSWTIWYSVGNKNLSWEENQMKICTVSTIEQFWFVKSQIKPPSQIPDGHTYSVFRTGILPDWEDRANVDGGRWMLTFSKKERKESFDSRWQELLVMMLGDHVLQAAGRVNGAEACVRKKGDRLEVWISDVQSMIDVIDIGRSVKEKIAVGMCNNVRFSLHKEDREGVKGPRLAL